MTSGPIEAEVDRRLDAVQNGDLQQFAVEADRILRALAGLLDQVVVALDGKVHPLIFPED